MKPFLHIFHKWRLVKISSVREFSSESGRTIRTHPAGKGYECDICGRRKFTIDNFYALSETYEEMMEWCNNVRKGN